MTDVKYHIEYNDRDKTTWLRVGPPCETFREARNMMANEMLDDTVFNYRIVKIITEREIVTVSEVEL